MSDISNRLAAAMTVCAAVTLIAAPAAGAENPPPCAPNDQQCLEQQQRQGAGIANEVIDNVQNGLDQANDALTPERSGGPGVMVLKDGVPWCMPLNQPIPPGAVITSPTGNGVSSFC
jgi:hypothetical protein